MLNAALSRRGFLAGATALGAVAAAGSVVGCSSDDEGEEESHSADIHYTLCAGCGNSCGLIAYVQNGEFWKAAGNANHPYTGGYLCGRGQAYTAVLHSEARVQEPLKRGDDGELSPVSWDEALADIAAAIGDTTPDRVVMFQDGRSTNSYFTQRFMTAIGSPNYISESVLSDFDILSVGSRVLGSYPSPDAGSSKYIVLLDKSYYEGIRPIEAEEMLHAREAGGHVVVVDPRLPDYGAIADEWVPVRAGCELAFLLGVMGRIASTGGYDADFGQRYGNGFDTFIEAMQEFTPEWAEEICDVSADKIIEIADGLSAAAPHCYIDMQWGGSVGSGYRNSAQMLRALLLANAMLGNFNQAGGLLMPLSRALDSSALDPAVFVSTPAVEGERIGDGDYPLAYPYIGNCQAALGCAQEGDIDVALFVESNPLRDYSDTTLVQADLDAIPFKVAISSVMNETASQADYVLPALTYLESEEVVDIATAKETVASIRTPVVEPVYPDAKSISEIMCELGDACGVGKYFSFSIEEYNEALCRGYDLDYEQLKAQGVIALEDCVLEYGAPLSFSTSSGLIEFVSQDFADAGLGLTPEWLAPETEGSVSEPRLILGDQAFQVRSYTEASDKVSAVAADVGDDRLWINPDTAAAAGVSDGDTVEISSSVGSVTATARVTSRIHPESVYLPPHYGCQLEEMGEAVGLGAVARTLVPRAAEPATGAAMSHEVTVSVKKVNA